MIIQCPKCLTKFKLDDSKVKDEGTKVRCAKCKEVFVVTKEAAPPPPPAPPELPAEKEEFEISFGPPEGEAKKEEAPSGFEGFPSGEEAKKEEEKEAGFEWGGVTYGEVSLPEAGPKAEETPFGEFEFKEEAGFEGPKEEALGMPAEAPLPPPPVEVPPPPVEEMPKPAAFAEERPLKGFEEGFPEEFQAEVRKERRSPLLKITALIVLILAAAAVPVWYLRTYKAAETGEINLAELNGYYTQNAEAGNLFVISGRAVNNTNKSRSFFQVKGKLFDRKGEKVAEKEVYCGNIFSPKEISTLPRGKIEADLKNRVGGSLSNINLAPGKSVPFMIVFFDLPQEMAEFSVEVVGSQIASE